MPFCFCCSFCCITHHQRTSCVSVWSKKICLCVQGATFGKALQRCITNKSLKKKLSSQSFIYTRSGSEGFNWSIYSKIQKIKKNPSKYRSLWFVYLLQKYPKSTEKYRKYRSTGTGDLGWSRGVHRHPYCRVFKLKKSKKRQVRIFEKTGFPGPDPD